jgi:hypothetical protein
LGGAHACGKGAHAYWDRVRMLARREAYTSAGVGHARLRGGGRARLRGDTYVLRGGTHAYREGAHLGAGGAH